MVTSAGGKNTKKKSATLDEDQLRESLVVLVGKVQALAKSKYERGHPRRDDYHIGEAFEKSRSKLEQASLNVLTHAKADTKLKIAPALITRLEEARTAYLGAQSDQSGKKTEASNARGQLEAKIKELTILRRQIQYAADAAWPAREKVHSAIRKEFKIPTTRALV